MGQLKGKIALVTGGSRGVGKGIALGLGEAGATVYVSGRTLTAGNSGLAGSLTETAEAISQLGGSGIAVRCDHRRDDEVKALFRQVSEEQGRLDILVNNAFSTPDPHLLWSGTPFWELPLSVWDDIHSVGLRSHYVASLLAAPLMIGQGGGLIVNVSSVGAASYMGNVAYSVGKAALDRMTADMALELRPRKVVVVSLWPGPTRTELVVAHPEVFGALIEACCSPIFNGRAVAALASDPEVIEKSGRSLTVPSLSEAYGFIDAGADPVASVERRFADREEST